jgi:anti-sigma B factor antagonist
VDDRSLTITQTRDEDRGVVLRLAGTLDAATVPEARQALEPNGSDGCVCVDLSGLSFVDSSGLALLVTAQRHAMASGRQLEFVPPAGQPARVLARMRLDELLRFTQPLGEPAANRRRRG